MNILLTNDDGIFADGIRVAAEILSTLGNVTIVAPSTEHSAVSSKITVNEPIRVKDIKLLKNVRSYSLTGTPADCVKFAISELYDTKPDVVVSGVNHGSNTGLNIIYSGTVAGALEGALHDIPSIAISVTSLVVKNFDLAKLIIKKVITKIDQISFIKHTVLNINIPDISLNDYQGMKWCSISENRYVEEFQKRLDPAGREYYWLGGRKYEPESSTDVDDVLIKQNYVTLTPVCFDFNNNKVLNHFSKWDLNV